MVVFSLFGASQEVIKWVGNLFVSIFIGAVFSIMCGMIIENFGGNCLKKYSLILKVGKIKISVSLFIIVTVLLKILLFK